MSVSPKRSRTAVDLRFSADPRSSADPRFSGLNWLSTAVVVLDARGQCLFLNESAEQLFEVSPRAVIGQPCARLFGYSPMIEALRQEAREQKFSRKSLDLQFDRLGRASLHLQAIAAPMETARDLEPGALLLEFLELDHRLRADREVQLLESAKANRELVRNLAHEIKNPLGGIRGAAQLLEGEMGDASLHEYTQVIIKEADRLQSLVDRLLEPHRPARRQVEVNIHEVSERVRSLVQAEFPSGLHIIRDYDASLPELLGDREQLIQVVLNLVRNAAQALEGQGQIILRTRVARPLTLAGRPCKLALDLHVIDNGPGIPEAIRERVFFPLVTGRDGGTGLGLSLAQTFVQQHGGVIECDSRPGWTDFRILLPLR